MVQIRREIVYKNGINTNIAKFGCSRKKIKYLKAYTLHLKGVSKIR